MLPEHTLIRWSEGFLSFLEDSLLGQAQSSNALQWAPALKLDSWVVCDQLFRKSEFRTSTTELCTCLYRNHTSRGSQALPTQWCALAVGAAGNGNGNMVFISSAVGEGVLHSLLLRGILLEVEFPGSMGLQLGQQDFHWSGWWIMGQFQSLSGWWCS